MLRSPEGNGNNGPSRRASRESHSATHGSTCGDAMKGAGCSGIWPKFGAKVCNSAFDCLAGPAGSISGVGSLLLSAGAPSCMMVPWDVLVDALDTVVASFSTLVLRIPP